MSDRLLFIDTETTGMAAFNLPPEHHAQPRVVQLAAIMMRPDGQEELCLNCLIKPDGWTIPARATEIHGITDADCEKHGWPIRAALSYLAAMARSSRRAVAHNARFDTFIVNGEFKRIGVESALPSDVYCTMDRATDIVRIPKARGSGFKWPQLAETYRHFFKDDFANAHDALADVRACAKCYFELVKEKP